MPGTNMWKKILGGHFALFVCLSAAELRPPFDVINEVAPRNNLLPVWLEFRAHEKEYLASAEWRQNYVAGAAWVNSYLGEYRAALASTTGNGAPPATVDREVRREIARCRSVDALDAIAAATQNRRVVMINEEHIDSSHRALTTELLPILRKQGFQFLAAEAFGPDIGSARYPRAGRYFTDDPVFGNLIRRAIELGFTLVPYEASTACDQATVKAFNTTASLGDSNCWEAREMGQAQNLARFLDGHPGAKLVVHGGMGHIQKADVPGIGKLMAMNFREITKIDPLSIDQVYLGEAKAGTPEYAAIAARYGDREGPFVLQSANGFFVLDEAMGIDIAVVHPRARYENGRPTWLSTGGWRKVVAIEEMLEYRAAILKLQKAGTTLLQAFRSTDPADAVPVDQFLIVDPLKPAALMLPKGEYRVRVVDGEGKTLVGFPVRTPRP